MVGAETGETFTRAEAVLGNMGAKIVHCGAVGTGGAVKICNNMLLAVRDGESRKHVHTSFLKGSLSVSLVPFIYSR